VTLLLLFVGLLALVLINVPIAVGLGVVALVAMIAAQGVAVLPNAALVLFNGATSFPLIAIPLFILAGAIMNASGISRRLIAFASAADSPWSPSRRRCSSPRSLGRPWPTLPPSDRS
jgi:C4-dicarboxylate transporter DctM subunit